MVGQEPTFANHIIHNDINNYLFIFVSLLLKQCKVRYVKQMIPVELKTKTNSDGVSL